ncbi:MAG: hypothetical protein MR025_09425 [Helicobacter trogontum]|uniref:hypothetical protein n=1 Tax=Helicobacter trogontum TaxID=50960 RepID=UPI001F416ACA|nr:hypothetical protein [Helicobacter trogontum]MCI5787638.1 hypothetical protein [Helicobacter trogontum]
MSMSYKIFTLIAGKFISNSAIPCIGFYADHFFTNSRILYRICNNKDYNSFVKPCSYKALGLSVISCLFLSLSTSIEAKNTDKLPESTKEQNTKANGLIGIPEDNRKIKIFKQDLYMLPYFHVQVGMGATNTEKIAQKHNMITESVIPTFMVGIGFQQQYYMLGVNLGYKLQLSYEVGVKSLGENTTAFRSSGVFFQIHAGYKYILPHINVGYEMLSVGVDFLPSANEQAIYADKGMVYGYGVTFLLNRYHALELGVRHSKIYGNKARFLFNYEFRF